MKFLIITLFFTNALNNSANDFNHTYTSIDSENNEITNVFYSSEEDDLYFIDFANITTTINEVKLFQEGKEVMMEDVAELNQNEIYELNLSLFQTGDYHIELILEDNTIIKNNFLIH